MANPTPFRFYKRSHEFNEALNRQIQLEFKRVRDREIPERNSQHFFHGRKWQIVLTENDDEISEMQTHSAEYQANFEAIISHRISILQEFRDNIIKSLHRQFMESLYAAVSRATEKSGNQVNASNHKSMADAFLSALNNIEFYVDEDGNVNLPEMHLGEEAFDRMVASLKEQGEGFHEEVERIKAKKIARAHEREEERLKRFPLFWK